MKKLIVLALTFVTTSVFATDYRIETEKGAIWTIHGDTVMWGMNDLQRFQVEGIVSFSQGDNNTRMVKTMTGCDTKIGGRIADVDETGRISGEQYIWLWSGNAVVDNIAQRMCQAALENMKKQVKPKEKTSI